jgi:hypothetical protein
MYRELMKELMDPKNDYKYIEILKNISMFYSKFSWFPEPDTIFDELKKFIGKWVNREELFLERCRLFLKDYFKDKVTWNIEWILLQLEVEVYTRNDPNLLPKMRKYVKWCKNNCTCTKLTSFDGKRYVVFNDRNQINNCQLEFKEKEVE